MTAIPEQGFRRLLAEMGLVFGSEAAKVEEAPAGGRLGDSRGVIGAREVLVHALEADSAKPLHRGVTAAALETVLEGSRVDASSEADVAQGKGQMSVVRNVFLGGAHLPRVRVVGAGEEASVVVALRLQ